MAVEEKYGNVEIPGVPADEPVFVLRAQDRLAFSTLIHYSLIAEQHGCEYKFIQSITDLTEKFAEWQDNHMTKLPD